MAASGGACVLVAHVEAGQSTSELPFKQHSSRCYAPHAQPYIGSAQSEAQVYNAAAEIGTGFMLIIQLLTPARSILLTFVYWYAAMASCAFISPDEPSLDWPMWHPAGAGLGNEPQIA